MNLCRFCGVEIRGPIGGVLWISQPSMLSMDIEYCGMSPTALHQPRE